VTCTVATGLLGVGPTEMMYVPAGIALKENVPSLDAQFAGSPLVVVEASDLLGY